MVRLLKELWLLFIGMDAQSLELLRQLERRR